MPAAWMIPAVWGAIGGAWLVALVAQVTGSAALLHHHALIENGPPIWLAAPIFLLGWQVMIAAMMLPASLPTIGTFYSRTEVSARPGRAFGTFIGAYALVWTGFGLMAFLGDVVLHQVVDASPWLAARPGLIQAAILGLAGVYQLVPLKRRSLAACRHPAAMVAGSSQPHGSFRAGLVHALACLGSSWALMLLMFAEGFASLGWMAALTALMLYEATGRHGQRAAETIGLLLLVSAAAVALSMAAA